MIAITPHEHIRGPGVPPLATRPQERVSFCPPSPGKAPQTLPSLHSWRWLSTSSPSGHRCCSFHQHLKTSGGEGFFLFLLSFFLFLLVVSVLLFICPQLQAFFPSVLLWCLSCFMRNFCPRPAGWDLHIIYCRNEKMLQVVSPPPNFLPKSALEDGEEHEDPGGAWRGEGLEHW